MKMKMRMIMKTKNLKKKIVKDAIKNLKMLLKI